MFFEYLRGSEGNKSTTKRKERGGRANWLKFKLRGKMILSRKFKIL